MDNKSIFFHEVTHTFKQIQNISEDYKSKNFDGSIIGIRFSRNFGKEATILAGLENSSGEYVSIIDADLQQDPKYIVSMLDIEHLKKLAN